VSRAAHFADAALAIDVLGLAPVTVMGQSLGGLLPFLLADARPDLVRRLVVADAARGDGNAGDADATVTAVERWL
jgi:pimeloyl-ACP methyl ester carboxylesterase